MATYCIPGVVLQRRFIGHLKVISTQLRQVVPHRASHHGQQTNIFRPHRHLYAVSNIFKGEKLSPPTRKDIQPDFRELFIPITRRSVLRHLMQEPDFLSAQELEHFEHFALALDTAIVNRYHYLLQELKSLFDPINPDKDTISTRHWNRRQRLDCEFWLLQKMGQVMEKANFHQVPNTTVHKVLAEKGSHEGVTVSVDIAKYDILRFWALGKESKEVDLQWYQQLIYKLKLKPAPKPEEYYTRVVVAIRLKSDDKLMLKGFKEVPVNTLEKLLPDGKIKMSFFDKTIMSTTIGLVASGILANLVGIVVQVYLEWSFILTLVAGMTAVRAWTVYKNRKNEYLVALSRMLYFKNISNNRSLLAVLVDRAEDELFKEALLTYSFLLTNRAPFAGTSTPDMDQEHFGALSPSLLEDKVEDWIREKTNSTVKFNCSESVGLLTELGLVSKDSDGNLNVLNLDASIRNLPISPQSAIDRAEEFDQVEGYDRDAEDEGEAYKAEETRRRKYGWM